jgi:DNA modification methylase
MADPVIQKMKLSELDPAGYNPRLISTEAMRGLRESIAGFGLLEMVVVNIHGGKKTIVSGHQRAKAMQAEGKTHADCLLVDFDDITEKVANVTMNNRAIQGTFDAMKALPNLESVLAQLPKPDTMGFKALEEEIRRESDRIIARSKEKEANDNAEPAAEVPVSAEGVVYKLGAHRLFSGRCEVGMPKLLGKKRAAACITDPPYNVAYSKSDHGEIENDDLDEASWRTFVNDFTKLILTYTDGPSYVFMSSKEIPSLSEGWLRNGGLIHRWLVWVKDSFTLGRGDYHHQFEPCLYGYRAGLKPPAIAGKTNVLEFAKPKKNGLHASQKPAALIESLMRDCTQSGDLVIDPFCGSGTTLVVAESIGRVCYAAELDLGYVDTIRKRWAEVTHGAGCDWKTLTEPT